MKNLKAKSLVTKLLCITLTLCLAFPLGLFTAAPSKVAFADTDDEIVYDEYINTVTISDSQFNVSTTNAPASSGSWTGAHIGVSSKDVVSGVIGLDSNYTKNYDSLKLDIYDEFKDKYDIPPTPFGISIDNPQQGTKYAGTNKNVLMINTNGGPASYGYSSSQLTLDSNSYYRFSVWVKTGDFGDRQGAAVTLTGLGEPVGIWNINTVAALPKDNGIPMLTVDNNYGFTEHVIYVGTGPNSENVKLQLSVGDDTDDHYYPSNGYAFFANVSLVKMSPYIYHQQTRYNDTESVTIIHDMNPEVISGNILSYGAESKDIGSFKNGKDGWTKIETDSELDDNLYFGVHDAGNLAYIANGGYGFTSDPYTPDGKYDSVYNKFHNNNIMVLSSYAGNEKYNTVSAGIKSAGILVEKESYYRLSLWYSTLEGASATVAISGESTNYSTENKLGPFTNSGLSSNQNTERYGWQRTSFYVKGSSYKDVQINVELWLGKDTTTSGIALFDNITFEKITYTQFTENIFGGTVVSIDSNTSSSTVTNGEFIEMNYGEDESYPLSPASWTYIDTATAGTIGHSTRFVPTKNAETEEDIVTGVILAEGGHYAANKDDNYLGIPNPLGADYSDYTNLLFMATPDKNTETAFGYRSSSLSISGGSDYKITVNMLTELTGYGANLVLKNGNSIVSTIENINTNRFASGPIFRDYSFYVSGAAGEASLTLEIWLGMTDRVNNESKLSAGYMFVNSVTMVSVDSAETTEKLTEYNNAASVDLLDFAVYRLGAFDLNAYDRYSKDPVKTLYDMSLSSTLAETQRKAGVITSGLTADQIIPEYFFDAHYNTESRFANGNVIYLENGAAGYTKYEADNTFALNADSYYRIDFSALVAVSSEAGANAVGAGIWLNDNGITDIRNTYKNPALIGNDGKPVYEFEFQTFSFYYATSTSNESVKWSLTMGGNEFDNQAIAGSIFINNIVVTTIDLTTFDTMVTDQEENEDGKIFIVDNSIVNEPEEPETGDEEKDDSGCNNDNWPVIPSILFAVAILFAIGAVVYRKMKNRRYPKDKNKEKVVSYDRNETLNSTSGKQTTEKRDIIAASDSVYDNFDETDAEVTSPVKKERRIPAPDAVANDKQSVTKEQETSQTEEHVSIPENEFDD